MHFGHWKAAAQSPELSEIHSLYIEIAISLGYALPRWMKALMVMLEKKPSIILPDKIWAITLLEADFNGSNKLILGKRMMANAEEHGLCLPEAQGSHKFQNATGLAFNQRLVTDNSRQQNWPLAIASMDAAQCYQLLASERVLRLPSSIQC
jgi:hypothetical protein